MDEESNGDTQGCSQWCVQQWIHIIQITDGKTETHERFLKQKYAYDIYTFLTEKEPLLCILLQSHRYHSHSKVCWKIQMQLESH